MCHTVGRSSDLQRQESVDTAFPTLSILDPCLNDLTLFEWGKGFNATTLVHFVCSPPIPIRCSCHAARPTATCHAIFSPFLTDLTVSQSQCFPKPVVVNAAWLDWLFEWCAASRCTVCNPSSWLPQEKGGTKMQTSWLVWLVCCRF